MSKNTGCRRWDEALSVENVACMNKIGVRRNEPVSVDKTVESNEKQSVRRGECR